MKRQEALAAKNIFEDARRLHTLSGLATGASGPHNVLSPTHSDAQTVSPTRGDLIVASSVPDWTVLTVGAVTEFLRSDGTDPSWASIQAGDLPAHASRHEVAGADLVNHDNLTNFVANEHIDHTTVSIIAGTGMSGGGTIAANRTLNCDITQYTDELAQDAVGTILTDTASINFTYNDGVPSIVAAVLPAGVDHGGLAGTGDDDHTQYFLLAGETTVAQLHNANLSVYSDAGVTEVIRLGTDGDVYFEADLVRINDTNTYISGDPDRWTFNAGGVEFLRMTETTQDILIINDGGADVDTRIEAVGAANAFFVQGSDGFVGIGDGTPSYILSITTNADSTQQARIANSNAGTSAKAALVVVSDSASGSFIANSAAASTVHRQDTITLAAESDAVALEFMAIASGGEIRFFCDGTAAGNEIVTILDDRLLMVDSDVAHGVTDIEETDVFFSVAQIQTAYGGAKLRGIKEASGSYPVAMWLQGYLDENADTTKTTAARGVVEVHGFETSGTTITNIVADGNVFAVRTQRGGAGVTVMFVDEDGDLYYDGSAAAYDSEDDIKLLRTLNHALAQPRGTARAQSRIDALGIVNEADTGRMVSSSRMAALQRGAILQLDERLRRLEARV